MNHTRTAPTAAPVTERRLVVRTVVRAGLAIPNFVPMQLRTRR